MYPSLHGHCLLVRVEGVVEGEEEVEEEELHWLDWDPSAEH